MLAQCLHSLQLQARRLSEGLLREYQYCQVTSAPWGGQPALPWPGCPPASSGRKVCTEHSAGQKTQKNVGGCFPCASTHISFTPTRGGNQALPLTSLQSPAQGWGCGEVLQGEHPLRRDWGGAASGPSAGQAPAVPTS